MTINATMTTPKRRQTLQGQVTATNKSSIKSKITRSAISSPMSSGPPSPKIHMKSKSLTIRGSPKKDLNSENSSEFLFDEKDTATTATTESIASPVQSDQTNPEESDPNSASIITSPTKSLENHESIEQAIKTLEEKIKLDQHEHAIHILLRQIQQPEYKDEMVDDDSSTVVNKKPVRTNTMKPSERKLAGTFPRSRTQSGLYSYNNSSQRPQSSIEPQRKTTVVSTLSTKNLCTCRDPDSFWCRVCENRRFKAAFPKWTSGNKIIDAFIQETQLITAGPFNYLEWIPFDKFRYIKNFGEGGYGSLSTATWLEGPRSLQDEKMRTKWKRDTRKRVVLKFLRNSEQITQEFVDEFAAYYKRISWDNCMLQCYGMSQDPSTKNYVIVLEYAEHGNLRKYLSENVANTSWKLKLSLACDIARALKTIHGANLIHRDFHCGNVLITYDVYTAMGDLGLCRPIDNKLEEGQVYGVLPYLAPEVIKKQEFSKSSDIYSFAYMMWEISSGMRPFSDRAHDSELAFDICMGLRLKPVDGTPPCYTALMEQCWDPDPSKRPSAESLHRTLHDWARKIIETPKLPYKVNTEFAVAEQWRIRRNSSTTEVIHPKAKYTSQLFDFRELNIPDTEEMACEIPHPEHAQCESSQPPAAESKNPPDLGIINQKTPSKEHVELEF
ncbi:14199_t:CDS:2 [Funneliformis geosporum]|nr:14199_t:CDS:2 [Funneliformis geosporum]